MPRSHSPLLRWQSAAGSTSYIGDLTLYPRCALWGRERASTACFPKSCLCREQKEGLKRAGCGGACDGQPAVGLYLRG
jgi:hypothetical protein